MTSPAVAPSTDHLLPLRFLTSGRRALIGALIGQADHVHRLEEMGLRRGATVEMVQSGSPCIVRVAQSTLCFRACDLVGILVDPKEPVPLLPPA